ncbi:MAG TPA: hypothetical protein VGQ76_17605 [Thermoanaerobaculia bacterium]|jgi:hypothetical protein|nr:hypothetical protein [Thermoanaerobaculia bacterium]
MAKKPDSDAEAASVRISAVAEKELLSVRQHHLLYQIAQPVLATASPLLQIGGITHWESLGCVGYIPESSLLEATITIKQPTGYSGGLCALGSTEYVRFFVDWNDGNGWQNAGVSTVQVHDISDAPPGQQHPLQYLVRHLLDTTGKRKFCLTPVLPKVRAVLSWNTPPSLNPNQLPQFGNRVDTRIQIRKRPFFTLRELVTTLSPSVLQSSPLLQLADLDTQVQLNPQTATLASQESAEVTSEADNMRFAYALTQGTVQRSQFARSAAPEAEGLFDIGLKVDFPAFLKFFDSTKANTDYEQLTCVALNPQIDTLGAVVRIKQSGAYTTGLCRNGSKEYVAFWADWNNNGTFDEYLGTTSVDVYNITRPADEPLDYAVQLPTTKFFSHLQACNAPKIIGIRAVLSWNSPPSTTDPNDLQTYGNRVDVRVQLRPGVPTKDGVGFKWYAVGSVPVEQISATTHLANPGDRPWGGMINVTGRISTDVTMDTYYSVEWKPAAASDLAYQPVTTSQVFNLETFPIPATTLTQTLIAGRWFRNVERALVFPPTFERDALLAEWHAGGIADGLYTLRVQVTADNPAVVSSPTLTSSETISILVCNTGFEVNPGFGSAVNPAYTLDIIIDGGDCKQYSKAAAITVRGHLRVIHPYYSGFSLSLEPSAHNHGAVLTPSSDSYDAIGDPGHSNLPWELATTAQLDPCGYVVTIHATDRTILNSNQSSSHHATKSVGLSVIA